MPAVGKDIASVVRYFRKVRGGSQAILAEASDGLRYVVKFRNNLQGPNLLFNESAGTELYRACGLPIPEWEPLLLTDAFLSQNRACWMETRDGRLRPASGLCFGSRFLGGDDFRLFEILPGSWFKKVRNLQDFWLAWVVDICAQHADNRQAIFREDPGGQLRAYFVDHGHMFGGANGGQQPRFQASRYLDGRIYQPQPPKSPLDVAGAIGNLDADQLWQRIQVLPDEWKTDSALKSFALCLERLSMPGLISDMLNRMVNSLRVTDYCEYGDFQGGPKPATSVLRARIQAAGLERRTVA